MSFESLLNEICTVQKNQFTIDSFGQQIENWVEKYANIACRLKKNKRRDGNRELGAYEIGEYILFVKKTDSIIITTEDRIIISGVNYKIIRGDTESQKHHYELEISKIL